MSVRRLCALDRYVRKWSSASVLVVRSVFRPKDLIRIGAGDHRRQVVSLQHVRNRKVVAVSAIASSGNFHSVLRQLGADIVSLVSSSNVSCWCSLFGGNDDVDRVTNFRPMYIPCI